MADALRAAPAPDAERGARAVPARHRAARRTPGLPEAPALASRAGRSCGRRSAPRRSATPARIETADAGRARRASRAPPGGGPRTHERVEIDYFAHSTGEWSVARHRPRGGLLEPRATGTWRPGTSTADDERLFRVDRIRRVEPTGRAVRAPGPRGRRARPLYTPTEDDVAGPSPPAPRRPAGSPSTTPPPTTAERDDGSLEVTLPAKAARAGWRGCCCGWGPTRRSLDPPELPARSPRPGASARSTDTGSDRVPLG